MRLVVVGVTLLLPWFCCQGDEFDEKEYGVKYADSCEVCKIVSNEFVAALAKSAKSHDVIETGYSVEKKKKKTKYAKSELRLVEVMDNVCNSLMEYSIHKERKDWTRFSRGKSQTFQALDGLVAKGVKVDIGIPQELWDKPSAEITHLKTQCESLLEEHEDDIETWYFHHQDAKSLEDYLCRSKYLKPDQLSCLEVKGETANLREEL